MLSLSPSNKCTFGLDGQFINFFIDSFELNSCTHLNDFLNLCNFKLSVSGINFQQFLAILITLHLAQINQSKSNNTRLQALVYPAWLLTAKVRNVLYDSMIIRFNDNLIKFLIMQEADFCVFLTRQTQFIYKSMQSTSHFIYALLIFEGFFEFFAQLAIILEDLHVA